MKIICVGRNYADHAKELGNSAPKEPVIFCKPDSAILQPRNPFVIPPWTKEVHHELELIIRIGKVGKYIEPKYALSYVDSISVGIDFTARDIQSKLKNAGLPWEKAKGFDGSAAIGKWIKGSPNKKNYQIQLFKNNDLAQKGNTRDFIFSIEEIICHISQFFTLKSGDIIFTGTPSGVASVEAGDELICKLDGNSLLSLSIR
jgi:2-keto-4-pentenoate hydratase/2-oxohepta-3-ene-1,7-dioic acid hydratase in catechol pathway|tara:strand:- start:303 stop:908 length:606 start_codon:yes stop_codon:yes gene_type:complete